MIRVAIDTNVLVYRHDPGEPERQPRARQVMDLIKEHAHGIVPVQCLAELSNVALRKLEGPPTAEEVLAMVAGFRNLFDIVPLGPDVVNEALRGVRDHQFAYYDAQIWAAARRAQATILVSEDFNPGAVLGGITFLNPFTDAGLAALQEAVIV